MNALDFDTGTVVCFPTFPSQGTFSIGGVISLDPSLAWLPLCKAKPAICPLLHLSVFGCLYYSDYEVYRPTDRFLTVCL